MLVCCFRKAVAPPSTKVQEWLFLWLVANSSFPQRHNDGLAASWRLAVGVWVAKNWKLTFYLEIMSFFIISTLVVCRVMEAEVFVHNNSRQRVETIHAPQTNKKVVVSSARRVEFKAGAIPVGAQ